MFRKLWVPVFAVIDLKQCTFKLKDGTGTPEEISIAIGEGNLTYSENKNMDYILDRGILDEVREGDQVPMEVSFDFKWDYITALPASTNPTVEEALKNEGEADAWLSSDQAAGGACRPYAVDIEVIYTPVPSTCGDKETLTFPDFRYETLDHDMSAGTVSCSGKCNALAPTIVRAAQ